MCVGFADLAKVKLQDHQTLQELLTDIEGPEGKPLGGMWSVVGG